MPFAFVGIAPGFEAHCELSDAGLSGWDGTLVGRGSVGSGIALVRGVTGLQLGVSGSSWVDRHALCRACCGYGIGLGWLVHRVL